MSRTFAEAKDLDISKIKPIADFVLIEIIEQTETAGGIIISQEKEGSRSECCIGRVIDYGSGEFQALTGVTFPLYFKPGEYVVTMEYMGERIEQNGKKYRLVRAHGIWCKLKFNGKPELMDIRSIEPITDHVLLKIRENHKTKGGIILASKNPNMANSLADVVAVGEGKVRPEAPKATPLEVKPGDTVAFATYAGAIIKMGGDTYRLCTEDDIVAVVEGLERD